MKTDPINEYEQCMKRRRRIFREAFRNPEVLAELKRHFQTDLPCFQGKAGSYDPLDAMRRDAYREVVLFIEAVMLCLVLARPCLILSKNPIRIQNLSIWMLTHLETLFAASSRSTERTCETPFSCIVTP